MGAWGFLLFQSDQHLDVAAELADEAGIESLDCPEDVEQVKGELEGTVLNGLFDRFKKQRPQPAEYIAILGALAMQVGARIRPEDLALIGRCAKRSRDFLMEGADQLKVALKAYKNDGTPYEFESPDLLETAIMGTPYPPGHPMHEEAKYVREGSGDDILESIEGRAGEVSDGLDGAKNSAGKTTTGHHDAFN
ncbi:MAG: hypothetical protein Q9187_008461 [Circinaria calcarea]